MPYSLCGVIDIDPATLGVLNGPWIEYEVIRSLPAVDAVRVSVGEVGEVLVDVAVRDGRSRMAAAMDVEDFLGEHMPLTAERFTVRVR